MVNPLQFVKASQLKRLKTINISGQAIARQLMFRFLRFSPSLVSHDTHIHIVVIRNLFLSIFKLVFATLVWFFPVCRFNFSPFFLVCNCLAFELNFLVYFIDNFLFLLFYFLNLMKNFSICLLLLKENCISFLLFFHFILQLKKLYSSLPKHILEQIIEFVKVDLIPLVCFTHSLSPSVIL